MQYWLMKSEPTEVSIDDLSSFKQQTVEWFGIRNYQARNFMRNQMQIGDLAFFWHSSCKQPGIYGIVKIVSKAHPDSLQFDINSEYYEPKSTPENPRWWCVDVQLVKKINYISIQQLRSYPELHTMQVLQKGNRLSITKVDGKQWNFIANLINQNSV
ncbi:MAG: EVE domain-containing protein [Burkholderiales bacterium]|nr:EVE domain-containing protein [Burkholderiales bacterium]